MGFILSSLKTWWNGEHSYKTTAITVIHNHLTTGVENAWQIERDFQLGGKTMELDLKK